MRIHVVGAAFVFAWGLQCGMSYAMADWLDKLSGPGPFTGIGYQYRFACWSKASRQENFDRFQVFENIPQGQRNSAPAEEEKSYFTWLGPFERSSQFIPAHAPIKQPRPKDLTDIKMLPKYRSDVATYNCQTDDSRTSGYIAVVYSYFSSKRNNLFPADAENGLYGVRIHQVELAAGGRITSTIDVLVSGGVAYFSGDAFKRFQRFSLTPVTIDYAPFAHIKDDQRHRGVKLSAGVTIFMPGFDGSDFCDGRNGADCSTMRPFHSKGELVPRLALKIDPAVFFP